MTLKPTVLDALDTFGLNRIRNPSQLEEIFTILEHARRMTLGSKVPPSVTISPCGSGKTESLKVIVKCLQILDASLKIVLLLPNAALLTIMRDQFKEAEIKFNQVQGCQQLKGAASFKAGINLSTHEVVAALASTKGASSEQADANVLKDLVLLVDEVDMAADDDLGWKGAEHFTAARFFYGCTASDLTI